jgi:hypothetical protein
VGIDGNNKDNSGNSYRADLPLIGTEATTQNTKTIGADFALSEGSSITIKPWIPDSSIVGPYYTLSGKATVLGVNKNPDSATTERYPVKLQSPFGVLPGSTLTIGKSRSGTTAAPVSVLEITTTGSNLINNGTVRVSEDSKITADKSNPFLGNPPIDKDDKPINAVKKDNDTEGWTWSGKAVTAQ